MGTRCGMAGGDGCRGRDRCRPQAIAIQVSPSEVSPSPSCPLMHGSIMPSTATAATASPDGADTANKVNPMPELLYRVAERFGLPVVILMLVLWWARTDIVQPLLDAHFDFIGKVVSGQEKQADHLESLGRKMDELIKVSSQK